MNSVSTCNIAEQSYDTEDDVEEVSRVTQACTDERVSFLREADMLSSIVAQQRKFVGRRMLKPFFEVQVLRGVADIIFAELDPVVIDSRRDHNQKPVIALAEMSALRALGAFSSKDLIPPMVAAEIASITRLNVEHLRNKVLPSLRDSGWIESSANAWRLTRKYESPVRKLVAVEAKRSDWRRALSQTVSHRQFADATFVAIDGTRLPKAVNWRPAFEHAGVGLLVVEATGATANDSAMACVSRILPAVVRRPKGTTRAVIAERVVSLAASGSNTGVVSHVFGRTVSAAWGSDLRAL